MNILFFGRYNREYTRNHVLLAGLALAGATIKECRVNTQTRWWFPLLLWKYTWMRPRYDVMLVPFPGHEVMFLARLLCRRPLVFDAFASHYGGYVLDRKRASPKSMRARWWRFLDFWSCRLANLVILDTQAHINFFVHEYGLPQSKFTRLFVGANEDIFQPRPVRVGQDFIVHFCGTFIPLQGVDMIVRAAALIHNPSIRFRIVGRGQTYSAVRALADKLRVHNIEFLDSVPYQRLAELVTDSDVCLGIFGTTPKTPLVIPNKVFEALASARALITADTSAIRELLSEHASYLIPAGNPQALADAIMRLYADAALRARLASAGHRALVERASTTILGKQLFEAISGLSR